MANIVNITEASSLIEQVLIHGDLSRLSPADRTRYAVEICKTLGLNPLTKPFQYIVLNGKLTLYATRDATDQLRKLHGVSIQISNREVVDDVYLVTARATDKTGRTDESIGAVPIGRLQPADRANAIMKAETKAKRRVTLSICGLGMLDESELDTIKDVCQPEPASEDPEAELKAYMSRICPSPADKKAFVDACNTAGVSWKETLDEVRSAGIETPEQLQAWMKANDFSADLDPFENE